MGFFSWLVTPDESLNYSFIAIVYSILSVISIGFLVAQYVFDVPHLTGWWIVTAPCIPALLYVLLLRSIAEKKPVSSAQKAQEGKSQ